MSKIGAVKSLKLKGEAIKDKILISLKERPFSIKINGMLWANIPIKSP